MKTRRIGIAGAEIRRRFAADPAAVSAGCFRRNVAAFLRAVARDEPFEFDGPEAREALALVHAIHTSAERAAPRYRGREASPGARRTASIERPVPLPGRLPAVGAAPPRAARALTRT